MKAFIILNEKSKPIAATTDEGLAMDILFTNALEEGRVDEEMGTFDFGGSTIIDLDFTELKESLLLTEGEIGQLEEEGTVLI